MADTANVCAACGKAVVQPAGGGTAATPATPLADNVAGMLAYITFIPAILFLVMEPYNKNRFIRFHAFQCLGLCVVLFVINMVLRVIPLLGPVVSIVVDIGAFILWILCLLKAYQGQMWKIPVLGDFAEKQGNAV